jgi:hypothetical protein
MTVRLRGELESPDGRERSMARKPTLHRSARMGSAPRGERGKGSTPPLGFEPRSQAPQACSLSKLTYEGAAAAKGRALFDDDDVHGYGFSASIARRKISSMRPLA